MYCSLAPVPAPIDPWGCGIIPMATREELDSFMDALEPIQVHQPAVPEEEKEKSVQQLLMYNYA